jgi:hypothetical protein
MRAGLPNGQGTRLRAKSIRYQLVSCRDVGSKIQRGVEQRVPINRHRSTHDAPPRPAEP